MKPTWEHEPVGKHLWRLDPIQHGLSRVFRQFELNWSLGLALDHRNTLSETIILHKIRHGKFDQIAAAQFAMNCDVEESQVA
ncbi:hypothetical protein SAMN05443551_0706 [Marivita hallyeonensis]|uniref:Uncharacterized protein n=1 Tax=Marivita hallyeonensis TaxID=996342 RepID=A0A1M5MYW3_9RHOB|nr:hypothetical protein SAMN05443551_0706 [Marivita hallyeonensis]